MSLSGITSLSLTARDVITFALRKLGMVPVGQLPDINEVAECMLELNMMLKGWETAGPHLWRNTLGTIPLVAKAQSYSLTTDNPLRVVESRYRNSNGTDIPMRRMSRVQYMTLPQKTSSGPPTQYYFDPQELTQNLYIWPVPPLVTTDTIVYTFQRRFQMCQSLNDNIDIPQEWLQTVGYCLAENLLPNRGVETQSAARIEKSAAGLLRKAKAFDRPAFVQFMPEYRPRS